MLLGLCQLESLCCFSGPRLQPLQVAVELISDLAHRDNRAEHPLARAIVTAAKAAGATAAASEFRSLTGRGVQATVDGQKVAVGGPALLRETGAEVPAALANRTTPWSDRGAAVLYVVANGQVLGVLALADEVRPESKAAIDALHAQGIHVVMITGDARPVAESVGRELGVDEIFAEVPPLSLIHI